MSVVLENMSSNLMIPLPFLGYFSRFNLRCTDPTWPLFEQIFSINPTLQKNPYILSDDNSLALFCRRGWVPEKSSQEP
jgi:hypothetical protein